MNKKSCLLISLIRFHRSVHLQKWRAETWGEVGSPDKRNWQRHNLQQMRILEFYCQIMQTFPERASHSRSDNWLTINTDKEQHHSPSSPSICFPRGCPWWRSLGDHVMRGACSWKGGEGRGWVQGKEGPALFRPWEDFIPVVCLSSVGCYPSQEVLQKYFRWTQVKWSEQFIHC